MNVKSPFVLASLLLGLLPFFHANANDVPSSNISWDMNVTQVAVGESAGLLYLNSNGDLFGAFINSNGMLGTGDTLYRQVGALVARDVKTVKTGNGSTAFLKNDGSLWGMGRTNRGGMSPVDMFGLGILHNITSPLKFAEDVKDFAIITGHILFVKTDGSLWGIGDGYALGLGESVPVDTATKIVDSGVSRVSTESWHTLFVKTDGSLWGMGQSRYGKLGNGQGGYNNHSEKTPRQIVSSGVVEASTGFSHSMFVKSDGSLWGMGGNWGRLGDGTDSERSSAVRVVSSGVSKVVGGVSHTLFIKTDGSLWGMGDNSRGQLGDGTTINRSSPIMIVDSGVVSASIRRKSFFVKLDGTIWGMGQSLFTGAAQKQTTPLQIPQLLSYDDKVGVSPAGYGDVVGYKNSDSNATLVPYPTTVNNSLQSPYVFDHWSGYFGTSNDANVTVPFDSNVTAHFAKDLTDPDNDGLTTYDELMIHDTNPDQNDTDNDGYSDGQEVLAETDPKAYSVPGDYLEPLSVTVSGLGGDVKVSGNSRNQVAVVGELGIEIYKIEDNGTAALITTIAPPTGSSDKFGHRDYTTLSLTDDFVFVVDSRAAKCFVFSIGDSPSDFSLVTSVPLFSYSGGPHPNFADGREFVVRGARFVQRREGDDPAKPYAEELHYWDVYRVENNATVTKVASLMTPTPEEVVGPLTGNPKGTLTHFQPLGYPAYKNGVVAIPMYTRFDGAEWMYVVRMSVDQNQTLSIHEPSEPGRISSVVMDDEQLIVGHSNSNTGENFIDTFRLSDNNRTTINRVTGSNEHLFVTTIQLDKGRNFLYTNAGQLVNAPWPMITPNKVVAFPTPNTEPAPPIGQYATSSQTFTLTDKHFVSLQNYTSYNLQNHPQSYNVLRVYPKAQPINQSPTDLNFTAPLTIAENQPIGTVVGEFNATDPDAGVTLTYHLVSGVGDTHNALFTLETNGTLKTAATFDYETNASTYSIRIQAKDEFNATVEGNFTVVLTDIYEPPPDPGGNENNSTTESNQIGQNGTNPEKNASLSEGVEVVAGWNKVGWFGFFFAKFYPWVYHENLGWIYVSENGVDGTWFHFERIGWVWTNKDSFPSLYLHKRGEWSYLDLGRSQPTLYDYRYKTWFQANQPYVLSGSLIPAKGGSVTGYGEFYRWETAVLNASASDGYRFSGWGGDFAGEDTRVTFEVLGDATVDATFVPVITPSSEPDQVISESFDLIKNMKNLTPGQKERSMAELLIRGKSETSGISILPKGQ